MKKDTFGRIPQNFKGTKDFDGLEAKKREYVVTRMKEVFELFGFEPLDTPAIELARILDGKYGEDGQSKLFKLNTGSDESLAGLRYDHTVPLARFMAMNPSLKVLPYRRYAIGKVWRNESVQAGRSREFTQCDFDTVGSGSLVVDAEILAINYQILSNLGFPAGSFSLQFNDRRLLNVMTEFIGCAESEKIEILRAWDKLEKVGLTSTVEELSTKGISPSVVTGYEQLSQALLASENKLETLKQTLGLTGEEALRMIDDLRVYAQSMGVPADTIAFNPLLARGLDYYTGPIFETVIAQSGIGSISGGGRFDNLISVLGGPDLRASGSSFGLERVITVMGLMGIEIPVKTAAPVFVTLFKLDDLELLKYSFRVASAIRLDGIPVEVYNGANAKLGKQIEIANRKKAQVVLIMGDTELSQQKVTIKVLSNGEQFQVDLVELTSKLQSLIS